LNKNSLSLKLCGIRLRCPFGFSFLPKGRDKLTPPLSLVAGQATTNLKRPLPAGTGYGVCGKLSKKQINITNQCSPLGKQGNFKKDNLNLTMEI
jgi:hypothetical protein